MDVKASIAAHDPQATQTIREAEDEQQAVEVSNRTRGAS